MAEQDKGQSVNVGVMEEGNFEGNIISQKTMNLLEKMKNISAFNDGLEKQSLFLKPFYLVMDEIAVREGFTGLFKASTLIKNNSLILATMNSEGGSISNKSVVGVDDPRYFGEDGRSLLVHYAFGTHSLIANQDKRVIEFENITHFLYEEKVGLHRLYKTVLTFGQFEPQDKEKTKQLLQECLRKSFKDINSKVEGIDDIEKFAKAPVEEWERVFGE